jgi:chemotaxis protein CheC
VSVATARQEDALIELMHLGSARGASMLARLVGDVGVLVDVPRVMVGNRWQLSWLLGGRDVSVLAATFRIEGELPGELWWLLPEDDARRLGQRLTLRPGVNGPLGAEASAALVEASNIVASAALSAIGTMVSAPLMPSTPEVRTTTLGRLAGPLDATLLETVVSANFLSTSGSPFKGWLVVLWPEASREAALRRLGV